MGEVEGISTKKTTTIRRGLAEVFALFNNLTLFLCNVSTLDRDLRATTNDHLGDLLTTIANDPIQNILTKTTIATMLRDDSTIAIVILNFMDTNLLALQRTIPIVFNYGVKAAVATRLLTFQLRSIHNLILLTKLLLYFTYTKQGNQTVNQTIFTFNLLFRNVTSVNATVRPLTRDPIFIR